MRESWGTWAGRTKRGEEMRSTSSHFSSSLPNDFPEQPESKKAPDLFRIKVVPFATALSAIWRGILLGIRMHALDGNYSVEKRHSN